MSEMWIAYWPVIVAGVLIGLAVGILMFRPRQKISLSSDVPIRPHMAQLVTPKQIDSDGREIAAGAAAFVEPGSGGAPDDLRQLKGVGPRLAGMLNQRGLTRFDQIAALSPEQIEAIDRELGAFRGRFERDRIAEQADYLARGDLDGYRARFGALEQSGGG